MTRRKRIALRSLGGVLALVAALIIAVVALARTDWGREKVRVALVARIKAILDKRGDLYIGRLDFDYGGHVSLDSVVLRDSVGNVLASAAHIEGDGSIPGFIAGRVHLSRFLIVRPYMLLEQRDSTWNVGRLFAKRATITKKPRSTLEIVVDSGEVRDGRFVLALPDSLPALPPVRREFSGLQLVVGHTRVLSPTGSGGEAPVRQFAVTMSRPPVTLRQAAGTVRWWSDSLFLDFTTFRLAASRASVKGTIAWALKGPARLDLRARADSIALEEISWIGGIIPKHGEGAAELRVRNGADPHDMKYEVAKLDLRATQSRIMGALTVTVGREVSVTGLALELQPLDLDLVRELLGDSVPPPVWKGALTGSVHGRGGPLRALKLDDVRLAYADRRTPGAMSHVSLAGELDVEPGGTTLNGLALQVADLDVRTLGAVSPKADSLHGLLMGSLVLDGPTRNLRFHDLALTHVDGDLPRSRFSGEGRLATDRTTEWFDANLSLDTIAVATVMRGQTAQRLRGWLRGGLVLRATRDTMLVDTQLAVGEGSLHFRGATLIDSTQTWVQGDLAFVRFDPGALIDRKDIPFLRLDGRGDLEIEGGRPGSRGRTDGHANIELDTMSRLGDSRVILGHVRAGVDSTGFHVDTAEIHATDWRLSASGRLARTGVTHDTLRFAVEFDSLAPLRALLLDSAGTSIADSLHGALFVHAGTLAGSLDTLSLSADFGVTDAIWNGVSVRRVIGHADLSGLPKAATGTVTASADSVAYGGYTARRVQARADVRDGKSARLAADIAAADTLSTRLVATLQRNSDTTQVALDSLGLVLGSDRWRLDRSAHAVLSPGRIVIDSTSLHSSHGASIALRASLPDEGAASGDLRVDGFVPGDIAFLSLFTTDVAGRLGAHITLAGTRDAPQLTFTANIDSVKVNDRDAPAIAVTGSYDKRRVKVEARGSAKGREILAVTGDLPVDLTLRSVAKRLLDDSLSAKVHADSATIEGLDAMIPNVEGLAGLLYADLDLRGTWKQVRGTGSVRIRNGAFELPKYGTAARNVFMDDTLSRDSVLVHLRMSDGDGPLNTLVADGALWLAGGVWQSDLTSIARNFKTIDDPRLATVDATWLVHLTGPLRAPTLEGDIALPTASFVLGSSRRVRALASDSASAGAQSLRRMTISSLRVELGNDVRLRSRDADVKLTGDVEIGGPFANPFVTGQIYAERGTFRVDLGVLKRTFRVDSGIVRVDGDLKLDPASLDIWSSYVVRAAEQEDKTIRAHLAGTTEQPTLQLSSNDLGSATSQGEIISYLVFGSPSFALDGRGQSTAGTATAALAPSLGGVLEGFLGGAFPFFSTLQVATIAGTGQNLNPFDGLFNSFALIAGRQVGADGYLGVSGGVCRGSQLSSTQSPPNWFGVSAEYRPKYRLSTAVSFDPGASPCSGLGKYQFGLDLFKEWKY